MKISLRTKKILSFFVVIGIAFLPLFVGAQWERDRAISDAQLADTSVYTIIRTIMMWLLLILTVIAVIGFIISGFMFIIGDTSGDKEKAKSWLTYSIIGVIVALIGYIVINLIDTILRGNVQQ
jgi:hypothetical protein